MYKRLTVKDWIEVQPNPIQRDTERHAAGAKHLKTPHPTHAYVFAAELPSGKLVKLDGHTRALLWQRKEVEQPPFVLAGIIAVKSMAEAEQLYKDFDSKEALETIRDKVSGAYNKHNFEPSSGLLVRGNIMSAMRMAYAVFLGASPTNGLGGASNRKGDPDSVTRRVKQSEVYDMINEFTYELHALDGFNLHAGSLPAGAVAAFIVSYRKYGHKITPFWAGVFAKEGTKAGKEMDAIHAVVQMLHERHRQGWSTMKAIDVMGRCLMGVEKWLKDEVMITIPRPLDMTGYLKGREKPSERLIKKADIERKAA